MAQSKPMALFERKEKIRDISGIQWIDYRSVAPPQEGCCIELQIPAASHHYIDLDHSLLKVRVGLTKADGTSTTAEDKVGLTTNVLNSIFSQVDVVLGDLNISLIVGSNHPYRAYLEVLLEKGGTAESSAKLKNEGYEKLSYGGEVDFSNDVNVLGALVEGEKTASFIGKIRTDACNLGKFIPNGVSLKIRLNQSSDAFRITSKEAGTYKMTIKECILKVC